MSKLLQGTGHIDGIGKPYYAELMDQIVDIAQEQIEYLTGTTKGK
jgi:hypothetical protein